jgi:hypothetical protein
MIGSAHDMFALEPVLKDVIIAWIIGQKLMMQIRRVAGAKKDQPATLCFCSMPRFFLFSKTKSPFPEKT